MTVPGGGRKKPFTMADGKTRSAGSGPWVAREDAKGFLAFCQSKGHESREHSSLTVTGYQVQCDEHWMGLVWNKSFKRYTADRRLEGLVKQFLASKA